ncbi:potassium channel subfamily K member 6-like [Hydractinia symbiolongicarpus]|uniref:potassium channel subfamily K member 6-like n=1 Tax=Hydractinia symbiolongicarpus TaxID=13093 RepID=UPI0025513B5E|nr:potassium channel subfamily K member 6-like [Hydractinia symbiolongicarpus]
MREGIRKRLPDRSSVKYVCGIFGWIIFYFIYLLLGGICMLYIERDNDSQLKSEIRKKLLEVLSKHNLTANSTATKEIISAVIHASDADAIKIENISEDVDPSWNIAVAVFFCSTIVTTIGYGNLVPVTANGKVFTILYAIVGIPITGFVLARIGGALLKLIEKCDAFLASYIIAVIGKLVKEEKVKIYVRFTQLGIIVFIFVCCFWLIPAAIMTKIEKWDFMTAVYFCFISISTIGLGDVVPGTSRTYMKSFGSNAKAVTIQLTVMLYLLMGLAALSIILNLIGSVLKIIADSTLNTAGNVVSNNSKKILSIVTTKPFRSNKVTAKNEKDLTEKTDVNSPSDVLYNGDVDEPNTEYPADICNDERDHVENKRARNVKKSVFERIMETDLLQGNSELQLNIAVEENTDEEYVVTTVHEEKFFVEVGVQTVELAL